MPLVKQAASDNLIRDALVLDLGDLKQQAEAIVNNARDEAARILAAAREEAATIISGAAATGHAEGHARGLVEGREEGTNVGREAALEEFGARAATLDTAWSEAIDAWERNRAEMLVAAREDVLSFALVLAEKIVFRIVDADPTVIEDQVAEALALLSRPTAASVRVHPDDRSTVELILPQVLDRVTRCEHVDVVEDASITRGGCVVRTPGGSIDATIETQIQRIAETLVPNATMDANAAAAAAAETAAAADASSASEAIPVEPGAAVPEPAPPDEPEAAAPDLEPDPDPDVDPDAMSTGESP